MKALKITLQPFCGYLNVVLQQTALETISITHQHTTADHSLFSPFHSA